MPFRQPGGKNYISFAEGVDDTTSLGAPEIEGTLSKADNTDIVDDFLCKKRNGYTVVNSAADWGTRVVRHGYEYTREGGGKLILVYGEDSAVTGSSGILGQLNGTAIPATIASSLADGLKPSIVQFGTRAFIFNGVDDFIYDESTTTRQIGITAPAITGAPVFVSNIDGALELNSSYVYCYTYYNSVTGAESSPSPASASMSTGATAITDGIRITLPVGLGTATTANKIKVYRSVAGGEVFYLDGYALITDTAYNSTVADAGLGDQLELDNSRPPLSKYAVVLDNRIFLAGDPTNPNRIRHSKVGVNGPMPESFQVLDLIDCNINDGDKIIGMGATNNTIIVIKERSFGKLIKVSAQTTGLETGGSTKYLYEEITRDSTALSHHTIISLDNAVIWMGRDDFYGTDGNTIYRFGRRIRNKLKTMMFSQAYKFSAVNKKDTQQLIFSAVRYAEVEPDFQFVGHYRNLPKIAWTYYTPGPNTTTHPGIRAGSLFEATINTERKVLFGSSNAVGRVYQLDSGSNDATLGIYWDVRLPWENGKLAAAKKLFHSYYTLATGNGNAYNLTHTFEVNREETVAKTATSSLAGTGTNWNAANWDAFNWASLPLLPRRFHPHLQAYFGRYGVSNTAADQPVAITSVTGIWSTTPVHR